MENSCMFLDFVCQPAAEDPDESGGLFAGTSVVATWSLRPPPFSPSSSRYKTLTFQFDTCRSDAVCLVTRLRFHVSPQVLSLEK